MTADHLDFTPVPLPRREPAVPFGDDVRERGFEIYSSVGARNDSATEHLLAAEREGLPSPSAETVRLWEWNFGWDEQANFELQRTRGRSGYDLDVM